jgi:3-oxoacyl-[acyl-carrier protein] reductase
MSKLSGKVAIVTGASKGIGAAIAKSLAAAGAAVVVNYYDNPEQAAEVVQRICTAGGRAISVQADVTSPADVQRLVTEARTAFGEHIHILVNNAGGLVGRKRLVEMDDEFIDFLIALNFKSVAYLCRAVIPCMPPGSAIVNLSSLAAHDGGGPGATMYAAGKGAVLTLSRGLAKELGPQKIRVNCVSPGMINTTFHNTFTKPEARLATAARTCIGREGEAEDVASAILFLASDAAAYITGESLEINGGLYFV